MMLLIFVWLWAVILFSTTMLGFVGLTLFLGAFVMVWSDRVTYEEGREPELDPLLHLLTYFINTYIH